VASIILPPELGLLRLGDGQIPARPPIFPLHERTSTAGATPQPAPPGLPAAHCTRNFPVRSLQSCHSHSLRDAKSQQRRLLCGTRPTVSRCSAAAVRNPGERMPCCDPHSRAGALGGKRLPTLPSGLRISTALTDWFRLLFSNPRRNNRAQRIVPARLGHILRAKAVAQG
jgi:hypothetical protein